MKNIFALALISFVSGGSLAQATSLHPCTPVIEARPLILACVEKDLYYGIRIHTMMSDVRRCPVKDMVEIHTAQVRVTDRQGNVFEEFVLPHEDISFSLGGAGSGYFQSKSRALDLKNCASPVPGGFSVGN